MIVSIFCLSSCHKKSPRENLKELQEKYVRQPEMFLDESDTNEVKQLVDYYLECLRNKQVDKAMSMLYFLHGDSIKQLPAKMAEEQKISLSRFAGYDYEVEYLKFLKETDSEVKYNVILFKKKPGDTRPNKIGFMIKPVRRGGHWYLTLADFTPETISSQLPH